jgi:hypothetical protein
MDLDKKRHLEKEMQNNPYVNLPRERFWKSAIEDTTPLFHRSIYRKRFTISPNDKIATFGSCFARHIGGMLKSLRFSVLDCEPAPFWLNETDRNTYEYGIYSARYGNIYTVAQLLQLFRESFDGDIKNIVWTKDGRYFDASRQTVVPEGYDNYNQVISNRRYHLDKVATVVSECDVVMLTLGLIEAWFDKKHNAVLPIAPGVISGEFDQAQHQPITYSFFDILRDLEEVLSYFLRYRRSKSQLRVILTVSPVPITATHQNKHVFVANSESKSILRSVAEYLTQKHDWIDYFPALEIISNPALRGSLYKNNLRSISEDGVSLVMNSFVSEHSPFYSNPVFYSPEVNSGKHGADCEEALIEAFRS